MWRNTSDEELPTDNYLYCIKSDCIVSLVSEDEELTSTVILKEKDRISCKPYARKLINV